MKIGDLVRETGMSERMLRHYEALGLIAPARSAGGTRHYDATDVAIARLIQGFRALDVPLGTLSEIARERRAHGTGDSAQRAVAALLATLARQMAEKAERSLALHRLLEDAGEAVRGCEGCANRPAPGTCPHCPMNAAAEQNPVAALVWQHD